MKKIINNKKYDTDTAEEIGYFVYDADNSHAKYLVETLYKKSTGEFFIQSYFYPGGPHFFTWDTEDGVPSYYRRYIESATRTWSRDKGWDIFPLSLDEAKEWVSKKSTADVYEELFGEPEE